MDSMAAARRCLCQPDCHVPSRALCPSNVIKAGGGQLVPVSRWHSAGGSRGGGSGAVDLVISKSASASSSPALAALVAQGALAATPG